MLWAMSMDRNGPLRNPQRPYARPAVGTCGKIWSDLYGDMQRPAEMTGPFRGDLTQWEVSSPLAGED